MAAIAPVSALLLSVALLLTGNGLQGTLLPVRASLEDFSSLAIGILGASYFVGFVAGCVVTPKLIRRVGHIRVFTAMVSVASAAPLAHALIVIPSVWWLLRAITGLCLASLYLIIESWLNERATSQNRGLIFTTYTTVNFSVITLGQLLMLTDDPARFPLYTIASILVSIAAVPVSLTRSPQPMVISAGRLSFGKLFRISPVGATGCAVVGLTNGAFWALAPAFVLQSGFGVRDVALFMSATVIGGALSQWPFGRLSDRMDRRITILIACAAASAAGLAIVAAGLAMPSLTIAAGFLFGVFSFPVYALSVAHTNDVTTGADFVSVAGGLLLINGAGSVIGPLLASTAMEAVGPAGLFSFTAAIHALMALFTIYRMRQRSVPADTQKADFVPMPAMVSVTSDMDPRAEEGGASGPRIPGPPEGAPPTGADNAPDASSKRDAA